VGFVGLGEEKMDPRSSLSCINISLTNGYVSPVLKNAYITLVKKCGLDVNEVCSPNRSFLARLVSDNFKGLEKF